MMQDAKKTCAKGKTRQGFAAAVEKVSRYAVFLAVKNVDEIGAKTRMTQAPYRLRNMAGEEEYVAGETLFERGGVRLTEQSAALLKYVVAGTPRREVTWTSLRAAPATALWKRARASMWWRRR